MKKFIVKTSFFVIPFSLLYCITLLFYTSTKGDLLFAGFIPNVYPDYRKIFPSKSSIKYDSLSNPKKNSYDILTIGDSFSEQKGWGYQNRLTNTYSVLHVDKFISKNQLQTLVSLSNGDFFDHYDVKHVILQYVERNIIKDIKNIKLTEKIMRYEIDSLIRNYTITEGNYENPFFSKATIRFPLYDLPRYYFSKNYLSNEAYNVEINTKSLFSNHIKKLLFYAPDLNSVTINNDKKNVDSLNIILNTIYSNLRKKNIELILLPSPDKYDFYYDFITDKKGFTKPLFFDLIKKVEKKYTYIDSKAILSSEIKNKKDIYFYDDTHWSPTASTIIAEKIIEKISK